MRTVDVASFPQVGQGSTPIAKFGRFASETRTVRRRWSFGVRRSRDTRRNHALDCVFRSRNGRRSCAEKSSVGAAPRVDSSPTGDLLKAITVLRDNGMHLQRGVLHSGISLLDISLVSRLSMVGPHERRPSCTVLFHLKPSGCWSIQGSHYRAAGLAWAVSAC